MPRGLNMTVTQSSIENGPSYPSVLTVIGLEYTRVVSMSRLQGVLCKLYFKDSHYLECLEF